VNAAYLMLTTAWLAGQDPAPPAAAPAAPAPAPAPAQIHSAPVVSGAPLVSGGPVVSHATGSCNGCGGGAAWGGSTWGGYGGCGADACCDTGKKKLFGGLFKKKGGDCCEAAPVTDCCESRGLFSKMKAKFKKGGACCDAGCDSGCGSSWGGSNGGGCCGNGHGAVIGGHGGVIGAPGTIITTPLGTGAPAEAIPAQPKPGAAPQKMPNATPMTMGGSIIHNVTPVVAPRLGAEQPF
jgi:hypothetical protein